MFIVAALATACFLGGGTSRSQCRHASVDLGNLPLPRRVPHEGVRDGADHDVGPLDAAPPARGPADADVLEIPGALTFVNLLGVSLWLLLFKGKGIPGMIASLFG